jgi:hypothetical protein
VSTEQELEQKVKSDFRYFLYLIWKHLNLPDPTPLQYDIAKYLQEAPKRCVIEAFRGVGKSWITSAFVVWNLYRNPQLKIMVVSASKDRADNFSIFTKRLISEVEFLQHLAPRADQRNSMMSFDVAPATSDHSPSVKSVGITGQLTGSRADMIIADDIEVLNNSATQDARDKLSELVKEFDAILKPLPTSRIIYLGTPQTEMSLYNNLEERGYEIRVWPARMPSEEEIASYKGRLAPYILNLECATGHTTDPKRFSDADLEERYLSYGKAGFALQFMLDTSLADADKYPLKLSDLIVTEVHPKEAPTEFAWSSKRDLQHTDLPLHGLAGDRYYRPMWIGEGRQPYTGKVLAIDPSGRGKDETAYCVGYMLNGYIFVPESRGLRDGYSDATLRHLANVAKAHRVHEIVIEGNFGDGMFMQLLKPWLNRIYPCTISEVKHQQQKEKRIIDTLEPVLMQHRLIVDPRVIIDDAESTEKDPSYSLFYQMARLTDERGALRHDDRLDCLSIMVQYWNEQMDADAKLLEKQRQEELLEQELRDFIENAQGGLGDRQQATWCSW